MSQRIHTVRYTNPGTGEREIMSFYSFGGPDHGGWRATSTDPDTRRIDGGNYPSMREADDAVVRVVEFVASLCSGVVTHDLITHDDAPQGDVTEHQAWSTGTYANQLSWLLGS